MPCEADCRFDVPDGYSYYAQLSKRGIIARACACLWCFLGGNRFWFLATQFFGEFGF